MSPYIKRFFPLRHKSIITPPARKVISKPFTKEITCSSNRLGDVDIKEVNDFTFAKQEQRLKEKIPLYIFRDRRNIEVIIEKLSQVFGDKYNITICVECSNAFDNECVTFRFTEKQSTPGFREMKISKKSRFYKENLCKTN